MKKNSKTRPDWDTYFMDIAHVVKRRSNCSRRDVAALIVKDRRIISTGYNGTPSGIKNCFEGGCPRCASNTPSGERRVNAFARTPRRTPSSRQPATAWPCAEPPCTARTAPVCSAPK